MIENSKNILNQIRNEISQIKEIIRNNKIETEKNLLEYDKKIDALAESIKTKRIKLDTEKEDSTKLNSNENITDINIKYKGIKKYLSEFEQRMNLMEKNINKKNFEMEELKNNFNEEINNIKNIYENKINSIYLLIDTKYSELLFKLGEHKKINLTQQIENKDNLIKKLNFTNSRIKTEIKKLIIKTKQKEKYYKDIKSLSEPKMNKIDEYLKTNENPKIDIYSSNHNRNDFDKQKLGYTHENFGFHHKKNLTCDYYFNNDSELYNYDYTYAYGFKKNKFINLKIQKNDINKTFINNKCFNIITLRGSTIENKKRNKEYLNFNNNLFKVNKKFISFKNKDNINLVSCCRIKDIPLDICCQIQKNKKDSN